MSEKTIAEMSKEIEDEIALDEKDIVGLLKPYCEARDTAAYWTKHKDTLGASIKRYIEREDVILYDGEAAIEARLQKRTGTERYDASSMPQELILALHQAHALSVDVAVIRALSGKDVLPEEVKKYQVPGPVTTALVVQEKKANG